MIFRPSREKRGSDPFLIAKIAIFVLGATVALIGIATNTDWVITVAIAILLVGFILRFLPHRTPNDDQ